MDTKLKADIAESAVVTELLKRGFRVLRPVGDRLPYDLALDLQSRLCRIQVKSAWFDRSSGSYAVDARRTKTNRRAMRRAKYDDGDFDFAVIYLDDRRVFYAMPAAVFNAYGSTVGIVEDEKRQRKPRSAEYRERWDLVSHWAAQSVTAEAIPVKFGEAFPGSQKEPVGNPEPNLVPVVGAGEV
ncbi:MAG: endonuclease [Candidatus Omnitrophica bacterium CG11_big_fil_rev_8_21_14_0_20_64_10]|nr:MAG: endonuclease [Candidatus Omnitrophica bacterium CG11_big_fil_rev_8_21_14_0_20_64_10]